MRTFDFEAMDSTGETQAGHLEAANAGEATQMLRARGLFVTTLSEATESSDEAGSSESPAPTLDSVTSRDSGADTDGDLQGRRVDRIVTVVGLVLAAVGLYGVIGSALFSIRGKRVDATAEALEPDPGGGFDDILEFTLGFGLAASAVGVLVLRHGVQPA